MNILAVSVTTYLIINWTLNILGDYRRKKQWMNLESNILKPGHRDYCYLEYRKCQLQINS